MEKHLEVHRPDLVVVVGDVNSTLAGAIVAAKLCIPVAHVEAGLRSGDRTMPEEINRLVTDALSDYLFTTSPDADDNLRREGVPAEKIFLVGNVMIDTLRKLRAVAEKSEICHRLGLNGAHGFVTLHRPGNVDQKEPVKIYRRSRRSRRSCRWCSPSIHEREIGCGSSVSGRTAAVAELEVDRTAGIPGFVVSAGTRELVLTDSGGLQEETTVLVVPCLTIRPNTERPITVTEGTNTIVGADRCES